MLAKILIVLALMILAFVIVVATRPAEYRVTRSAVIAAPADVVFAQVNELKKWEAWNPWGKIDPNMKLTYEGPPSGVGAAYAWAGNNQVGAGRMIITESRPHELVRFNLEFFKPMAGTSAAEFTFRQRGDQTAVTWSMSGRNNFVAKAVCLFMNMDQMVGGQFEKGLADLKSIAEAAAKK
jgi:hypothetical protein